MKIGILTFHRAHNYGAVLQAYALKKVLTKFGDVSIIDYWPNYHKSDYSLFDFRFLECGIGIKLRVKLFRTAIRRFLLIPIRVTRWLKFKTFIRDFLDCKSKPCFSNSNALPQDYGYYFYGSDQIWRVYNLNNYPQPDLVYLGQGIPPDSVKASYAASMGDVDVNVLTDKKVSKLLKEFDYLGVRENSLSTLLKELYNLQNEEVLDPTFLIAREFWEGMANRHSKLHIKDPYLLFYNLNTTEESRRCAKSYAHQLKLRFVEINGFESFSGFKDPSIIQTAGPFDFLFLIKNANFVISTSFHGVVFSIIFQKQFFVTGVSNHSCRVIDLLNQLNIPDRYVTKLSSLNCSHKINYNLLEVQLNNCLLKSNSFLKKIFAKPNKK